jgi:hypothetical protein
MKEAPGTHEHLFLKLKTRCRFCPFSLSLSMRFQGKLKPTGDNLKVFRAEFFRFMLGSFSVVKEAWGTNTYLFLKLKTRPRFCLAS